MSDQPAEEMSWDLPESSAPEAKPKSKRKSKAEQEKERLELLAEQAFEEREAEGLRCLDIIKGEAPKSNNELAESTNQLAGLVDSIEEKERTALARAQDWTEGFLRTLAKRGTILAAYKEAGITRSRVYELMDTSPAFKAAVDAARVDHAEYLEDVAMRRALAGSDRLLEFLLRGSALGQKYRDTQQQINIQAGSPIIVDVIEAQPIDAQVIDQS